MSAERLPTQAEANEDYFRRGKKEWAENGGFPSTQMFSSSAKPNGALKELHPLKIRSGFDILKDPIPVRWLLRPYLEEAILALIYGNLGTLKSFIALHWGLQLAQRNIPVIYLTAEGKGLERRIRGWCQRHVPERSPEDILLELPFYAIERAIDLPQSTVLDQLEAGIAEHAVPPKLIVVDTLARYAGALDENKAQDVAILIAAADRLRLEYGATILLVHHTGHAAKDRARGSYALMAATDAHFLVERPDPQDLLVTITTGRLKDSESPAPFSLRAEIVNLGYVDEDRKPVTTLILNPTAEPVLAARKEPTGKNVQAAIDALRTLGPRIITMKEVQEATKGVIPHRGRRSEAITWLQKNHWLTPTVGGLKLET
jgi:hypothetical protein